MNGLEIKVVPVSPLAQAQNTEEINTVVQFLQLAQGLGPEGQLAYRPDAIIDYIADKLGVPVELRTTPEERAQMQAAVMQAAGEAAGVNAPPASAASLPPQERAA